MASRLCLGAGLARRDDGGILDVLYPAPMLDPPPALADALAPLAGGRPKPADLIRALGAHRSLAALRDAAERGADMVVAALAADAPPQDAPQAFLKLHLLSHRLARPGELNLDGIFGALRNLAWTCQGPMECHRVAELRAAGQQLQVRCLDRFPPMLDYVIPDGVRIADPARVRLGAYLGAGTTVMHEGFVNFNAGCEGPNMVEGRISSGVMVGGGSDLGGGASTMGTLSGGGRERIRVGRDCLIGANAGIGISLGDRCTVEAGLYVTAGTKVRLLSADGRSTETTARQLSGRDDMLFRRHSLSGAVECLTRSNRVELNQALHSN